MEYKSILAPKSYTNYTKYQHNAPANRNRQDEAHNLKPYSTGLTLREHRWKQNPEP